ncbi:MAG: hypothetical protein GF328_13565 [Candidatus Latescibacteria bacterium]|nr:hypothetical protein [Candidatus Latescibacterota bacterium]
MMETASFPTTHSMAAVYRHYRDGSRKKLFEFLLDVPDEDFVRAVAGANGRSLRDLLVHLVDASGFWISLIQDRPHTALDPADFATVESVIPVADESADRIDHVLRDADPDWFSREMAVTPGGIPQRVVPAQAFVHLLTHEFHHKGQIVLLARMLGHEPPETDYL